MSYLFGFFIATISLIAAIVHMKQEVSNFWDFVAFVCVIGGTSAVAVAIFPWQYRRQVFQCLKSVFKTSTKSETLTVSTCIDFIRNMQRGEPPQDLEKSIVTETLLDGVELHSLGFSKEKIHNILEERILQQYERSQKIANSFRSLSKYPPAFGLAGTVLGLVSLMRRIADGADAKQTGLAMAIALMATFYGLLVSNILVNPMGEFLQISALQERKRAEIALHSVLLYVEGASLLEAQEVLNSYVEKSQRINAISMEAA